MPKKDPSTAIFVGKRSRTTRHHISVWCFERPPSLFSSLERFCACKHSFWDVAVLNQSPFVLLFWNSLSSLQSGCCCSCYCYREREIDTLCLWIEFLLLLYTVLLLASPVGARRRRRKKPLFSLLSTGAWQWTRSFGTTTQRTLRSLTTTTQNTDYYDQGS